MNSSRIRRLSAAILPVAICFVTSIAHAGYIDHFATYEDIGVDKAPAHGVSNILVVPMIVDESNLPSQAQLLADIEPAFDNFAGGYTFRNYFDVASLGRYDAVATIAEPIVFPECPFSRDSAGHCTIARGDWSQLPAAMKAIRKGLEILDTREDFRDYDINGAVPGQPDGVIDGILVLTNIYFGGIALPFHRLCELAPALCVDEEDLSTWNPVYDGVMVPWVGVGGALGANTKRIGSIGVHEFGHLLGFADLYDERGLTTSLPYSVMGGWNYNQTPQLPNAFSRYVIGWGNVVQVGGDGAGKLRPAWRHGDVLKFGTGSEYFLAEYRVPEGPWDGDIAQGGVAITHVNLLKRPNPQPYSFATTLGNCVNCESWQPMLMLEQADGAFELQQGNRNRDDIGDLFRVGDILPAAPLGPPLSPLDPALNSNRYDGTSTGIEIEVVGMTAKKASLTFKHPTLADPCADLLCFGGQTCSDGRCVSN